MRASLLDGLSVLADRYGPGNRNPASVAAHWPASLGMPHHCADQAGSEAVGCWAFAVWVRYGAMVPNRNGAVTSAVLVHLRVEPAHFDWRWRERPALALLVWEA
jgi:hypothetical protein